jgi:hypothetical protein
MQTIGSAILSAASRFIQPDIAQKEKYRSFVSLEFVSAIRRRSQDSKASARNADHREYILSAASTVSGWYRPARKAPPQIP